MMGSALVLRTDDEVFTLAERINKSSIVPSAYRGKAGDIAVAILYGQELGLAPMTALNRIVVIDGKPTLDAQGMTAVIRQAGHSLTGTTTATSATVTGTRGDNGDTMTVTFTIEDAKKAGLTSKSGWQKYPADMCWARSVSRIGRELFSDCLLGFSYTPEEADFSGTTVFSEGVSVAEATVVEPDAFVPATTRRTSPVPGPEPVTLAEKEAVADDDIAEAEIVFDEEAAADLIEHTFVAADGTGPVVVQELANEPEKTEIPADGAGYPVTIPEINGLRYLLSHTNPPYRTDAEINGFLGRTIGRADTSPRNLTRKEFEKVMQVVDK
jgi:hypothetical protein